MLTKIWPPHRFEIVSLFDMLIFPAAKFLIDARGIGQLMRVAEKCPPDETFNPDHVASFQEFLNDMRQRCEESGLKMSVLYLASFDFSDPKLTYREMGRKLEELHNRMRDELLLSVFLQIPADRIEYYKDSPQFGELVATKFSKAVTDIQEAAKCYATGRSTACVFHLMRVMESAVQHLGQKLKINLVDQKNWHNILDEVDKAIKGLPAQSATEKSERNRYEESSAHLRMVKDAWRNDVMHPKETYSEEEAERIFRNVKDFMVHLATKL
jgi:hypothetical protein